MHHTPECLNHKKAAKTLRAVQGQVMRAWECRARQEVLPAAAAYGLSLRDGLPLFLARTADFLESPGASLEAVEKAATEHGEERALGGQYTLDQVMQEYAILRQVLFTHLQAACPVHAASGLMIHACLDQAVRNAVVGFTELAHQALQRSNTRTVQAELQSGRQVKDIANAIPQIVWTAQPDGTIDWYNQRWHDYTGFAGTKSWITAESPLHQDDRLPTVEGWERAFLRGAPFQLEFRLRRASDAAYRWHLMRAAPVRGADQVITQWIGSSTDIHDYKLLVHDLERERDLRERFVAALTHDLSTPMAVTKMTAQLLLRKPHAHEQIKTLAARIVANMDRADRMIRDLLDANRIKAGEGLPIVLAPACLDEILRDVSQDLHALHGPRFRIHNSPNSLAGRWDRMAIQRVVENLVGNAVKYGKADSPVDITLRQLHGRAEIAVHNEGGAISLEDQKTLFTPYRRTQSALLSGQRGWGIGLTLVKGITEAHGGTVRVDSAPERGTTFYIELPLLAPHREHATTPASAIIQRGKTL